MSGYFSEERVAELQKTCSEVQRQYRALSGRIMRRTFIAHSAAGCWNSRDDIFAATVVRGYLSGCRASPSLLALASFIGLAVPVWRQSRRLPWRRP